MLKAIIKRTGSLSMLLGYAGGYILFCMMLLTVCDVIGRYAFNSPITGAYEVTETMMVATVFFFIPFTQKKQRAFDIVSRLGDRRDSKSFRS